jgi:DNA modification methylase
MIELLNIDCMEYMATLPDKAFDLCICDPPYGINMMDSDNKSRDKLAKAKDYKKIPDSNTADNWMFVRISKGLEKKQHQGKTAGDEMAKDAPRIEKQCRVCGEIMFCTLQREVCSRCRREKERDAKRNRRQNGN